MKIKSLFIATLALTSFIASAQQNEIKRLPKVDTTSAYKEYDTNATGFWIAAEASAGYSCRLQGSNISFAEVDVTAGYRFNDFLRLGLGIGSRRYFDNHSLRAESIKWSFPLYANVRGNIIPSQYRSVVPYYSVDAGVAIHDGFMFRPVLGLRIGRERSAFLVGVGYLGQNIRVFDSATHKTNKFLSFATLRLGYEF